MGRIADTRYKHYPWDEERPAGVYEAPFGSNEYLEVNDAIESVTAPDVEIASRRCPLPQIDAFPPRYGYTQTAAGIDDILRVARLYPDQSRSLSGTEAGYIGSSRNTLGNVYG